MRKIKLKLKNTWQWLRKNVLNKSMFFSVCLAELIFWSPCIVTAILGIFVNSWYWTAFGAICAFWAGPFTPAVPLQLALAVAIKKLINKIKKVKDDDKREIPESRV